MFEPLKGQSPTLSRALCDCISHADWLSTVIIVTWRFEEVSFITSALSEFSFLLQINNL